MPKYLIHAGPHKTATPYPQLRFDAARKRFLRQRVAYPTEWYSAESEPVSAYAALLGKEFNARLEDMAEETIVRAVQDRRN